MVCLMPNDDRTQYGLKECTIAKLVSLFASVPEIQQAILYGSRAKGTFRNSSDIDLTLRGDLVSHSQLQQLENKIDDLLLPYGVDLSLLHQITNPELLDHINRVGIVLYERKLPNDVD